MYTLVFAALLISTVSADSVKFTDCGKAEVKTVDIAGCMGDTCSVKKDSTVKVSETFTANQDTAKVTFKLTAVMSGVELTLPGVETDACKVLACPLKKGMTYTFTESLKVDTLPVIANVPITGTLTGDSGVLTCTKISLTVTA